MSSNSDDEDPLALFRQAAAGAKKLRQDTIAPPAMRPRQARTSVDLSEPLAAPFFFSEDYQPLLDERGCWRRDDAPADLLARARRGEWPAALVLDLHGLDRATVKLELAALIDHGQRRQHYSVLVICGRGQGILKDKVPAYLAQHPAVIALLPAPRSQGGQHAVLALLDHPEAPWRLR